MRQLVDRVGTGDQTALTIVQQNSLQQYAAFQSQFAKVRFELMQAQTELEMHDAQTQAADADVPLSDSEITAAMRTDAAAIQIRADKQRLLDQVEIVKVRVHGDSLPVRLAELDRKIQLADERYAARKTALKHDLIENKREGASAGIEALRRKIALLTSQESQLQKKSLEYEAEAKQAGRSSIDVEMMRSEITAVQDVLNRLGAELERTRVEIQSDSKNGGGRATLMGEAQPARVVASKSRLTKIAGAGFVSFMLPILLVIWLDARKSRINSGSEIEQALGLSVIGSMPKIPPRVMLNLDGPSERHRYWRTLLSESVDSIAAVLLRGSQSGASRIVMVSSAHAGEGKTTLAAHLATSLAGAGCRTALVDFDLRRPSLHRVLGLSIQPGVSEILGQTRDFESAVQATPIPNLMFIPAGRWTSSGLSGLSKADLERFFKRLRSDFDFVIVDGSPILPVVDTRLIAQHVDAVVLSVLRDVSCAPEVRAACQLLEKFGVPIVGVVVTGDRSESYSARYDRIIDPADATTSLQKAVGS